MTLQSYHSLIAGKRIAFEPRGFDSIPEVA
jgi:hypothetical protein